MELPYFYIPDLSLQNITLDEATSRHIIQVLRMEKKDELNLTNGKGERCTVSITDDHRKHCSVTVLDRLLVPLTAPKVCIAISLLKNASRFEWFLEKATEVGVREIIPLICERTNKNKIRTDRFQNIMISALVQSQQSWLPVLQQPLPFAEALKMDYDEKLIAHCLPTNRKRITHAIKDKIIFIGPEGDFTEKEIALAIDTNCEAVTLGHTRLRTETAGIVAAALLTVNEFDRL